MHEPQNFGKGGPRHFNAFKFKNEDEKAPKLGYLSEEVMSYYRQVYVTLENGFDDEDPSVKRDFLDNVYMVLKDEGIQVAQNQTVSRILEALFRNSAPIHLQKFFGQYCKELSVVSFDRFASHVFQNLVQYLPVMYDDTENKDGREQLKPILEQFCQFTESHLRDFMTHTYASHVLRSLLEVLSGAPVKEEVIRSSISRKQQHADKNLVMSRDLSDDYKTWFVTLKDKIIRLCNYEDHLNDTNYCPVLQTVLLILHKVSPSEYVELSSTIITRTCPEIFIEPNCKDVTKSLPLLVQNDVGSYLMELLISLASESQLKDLYNAVFKGKIVFFAVHPMANYVLQRMLTSITDKDLFLEMVDETIKYLEDILAANHVGIVTKLADACKTHHVAQDKVLTALMSAFHCQEPEERQQKIIPLIASMQTHDVMFSEDNKLKGTCLLKSVNIHGSLILQQLVHFDNTRLVASSLLELSPPELSFLCCDKSGNHIVDAFFQSLTVKEKNKESFIQKLKGMYVTIACNRNGSRCLETIWKGSSLKRKTFIADELVKGHERIESDQWGHFLNKNFSLLKFSHRRKEWIDIQNGTSKKQQLLQNILDGNVDKKKKKKRNKHEQKQDESQKTVIEESETNMEEESAAIIENTKISKKRKAAEAIEEEDLDKVSKKKKKKKKKDAAAEDIETNTKGDANKNASDSDKISKKKKKKKKKDTATENIETNAKEDANNNASDLDKISKKKKKRKDTAVENVEINATEDANSNDNDSDSDKISKKRKRKKEKKRKIRSGDKDNVE